MSAMTCPCGKTKPHAVAHRETADGLRVELWDDGAVTGGNGYGLDGVPVARPRTPEALSVSRAAGWLFVGEVSLWERADLGALYAACRKVAVKGGLPGDVRAAMAAPVELPPVKLHWDIRETDNHGDTTLRVAQLPRMLWPGMVVWHERGRYELLSRVFVDGREALSAHGLVFASQRELFRHLRTTQAIR